MNKVVEHLINHNVKPSLQRIAIMKYLMENKNHPTVDTIYNDLLPQVPTLSRTTIYNTLKVLEGNKALITLDIDSKNLHYDGDVSPHAHFMCNKCGKIHDMPIPIESLADVPGMTNFKIEDVKLYYKGICEECNIA
ncbi:MAG: Fur family transcriptional regulator [Bacteroidales bacterium]